MNEVNQSLGLLDPEFLRRLERLTLIARRAQAGTMKGERKSPRKGVSIDFCDYRQYVQGDDLRHVDWNIFARLDDFHLKLFEEHEDFTVHLLIDGSRSMGFGDPMKLHFACRLAAALGYIGLAGYDRVCAEIFGGGPGQALSPVRGKANAGRLFAFLESAQAEGATRLEDACKGHFLRHRARGMAVMISDFFDPEGVEQALRRLALSGSDCYAVQVLAPEEYDPEVSGDLKLKDCETGSLIEVTVSAALLKRYCERREEFCDEVRKACLRYGVGYFLVRSGDPVDRLVLEIFRRGGLVK